MKSLFERARELSVNPHGPALNRRQRRKRIKEIIKDKNLPIILKKASRKKVKVF